MHPRPDIGVDRVPLDTDCQRLVLRLLELNSA
jgi:hypothetical protein